MKSFNKLLTSQVLPENQSEKEKENERVVISELMSASQTLEELSPGEGSLAVCIFALRQSISLRNAGNHLAYQLNVLNKRLNQIENDVYEEDEEN